MSIDSAGFEVEPLSLSASCTPRTVSAHMIYETTDPYRMREPAGYIVTEAAEYSALDDRRVRVTGSRFEAADPMTLKLEGSAQAGYETYLLVGIRDSAVLERLDEWSKVTDEEIRSRVAALIGAAADQARFGFRCYGSGAILGPIEFERSKRLQEVAVLFKARAVSQQLATAIAKVANPILLHQALPNAGWMPSFAFTGSPAEIERGAVYEFVLHHAVEIDDPLERVRIEFSQLSHG